MKYLKLFEKYTDEMRDLIDVFQDIIDDHNFYECGNSGHYLDGLHYDITKKSIYFFETKNDRYIFSKIIDSIDFAPYVERLKKIGYEVKLDKIGYDGSYSNISYISVSIKNLY